MNDHAHELDLLAIQGLSVCRSFAEGDYDYETDRFIYSPETNRLLLANVAKIIRLLLAAQRVGNTAEQAYLIGCLSEADAAAIDKLKESKDAGSAYVVPIEVLNVLRDEDFELIHPRKDRDSREVSAAEFIARFREEVAVLVAEGVRPDKAESLWLDNETLRIMEWKPDSESARQSARGKEYSRTRNRLYARVYRNA